MTKELFQINDIILEVNPSDIKVLDDNYVVEESYLRSNAVYANRSKYAATKIAITIPLEMTDVLLTSLDQINYKTLPDNYKVICQLSNYPFCFIKSNRLLTYINPPSKSATGFMIFAVSELNLSTRAEASNIVFLELILVYFNHSPFIKDFKFAKYINADTSNIPEDGLDKLITTPDNYVKDASVVTLAECESWQRYFQNIFFDIAENIKKEDFLRTVQELSGIFTSLRIAIATPIVRVVTSQEVRGLPDKLVDNNTRYVFSMNLDVQATDVMEQLLSDPKAQVFTAESFNQYTNRASNKDTGDEAATPTDIITTQPNNGLPRGALTREAALAFIEEAQSKENIAFLKNIKIFSIDWADIDLETVGASVQSFKISRRNKLAINHIASYKHPIVQHLGKAPSEVTIQYSTNSASQYMDDIGAGAFIKDNFNIIDLNKAWYPQMMAYNYLKIKTIPSLLLGSFKFLPNQIHTSASSSEQGVDNFVMTFVESDLESLLNIGELVNSGKNANSQSAKFTHEVLIKLASSLIQVMNDPSKLTDQERTLYTRYYQLTLLLLNQVLQEFGVPNLQFSEYGEGIFNKPTIGLPERLIMSLATYRETGVTTDDIAKGAADIASGVTVVTGTLVATDIAVAAAGGAAAAAVGAEIIFVTTVVVAIFVIVLAALKYFGVTDRNPMSYKYAFDYVVANTVEEIVSPHSDVTSAGYIAMQKRIKASREKDLEQQNLANKGYDEIRKTTHIPLLQDLKNVLKNRLSIVTSGQETDSTVRNRKSLKFSERVEVNQLLKQIISELFIGANNGDILAAKIVAASEEDFGKLFEETRVSFIGQAFPDLKLENVLLTKANYVEEADITVQNVNPFFFLVEEKWLDETVVRDTFGNITLLSNKVQESLEDAAEDLLKSDPDSVKTSGLDGVEEFIPVEYYPPKETIYTDTNRDEASLQAEAAANVKRQQEADLARSSGQTTQPGDNSSVYNVDLSDQKATKPKKGLVPKNLSEVSINHDSILLLDAKANYLTNWPELSDMEWLVFANGVAYSETDNYNYDVKNPKTNFYGKFQMGAKALSYSNISIYNDYSTNTQTTSVAFRDFMSLDKGPKIQSDAYARYIAKQYEYAIKNFNEKNVDFRTLPRPIQLACISASHLAGQKHVYDLWKSGKVARDGSGVGNSVYYNAMFNLQTELAQNKSYSRTDLGSDSGQKANIEGTIVRAASPNTFIFRDKLGVETEYQFEGIADITTIGILDENKLKAAGLTLQQLSADVTNNLQKTLSTVTNVRIEIKQNAISSKNIQIVRAFGNHPLNPGRTSEISLLILVKDAGLLDQAYLVSERFTNAYRIGGNLPQEQKYVRYEGMELFLKDGKLFTDGAPALATKAPNQGPLLTAGNPSRQSDDKDKNKPITGLQSPVFPFEDGLYKLSSGFGIRSASRNHYGIDIVSTKGRGIIKGASVRPRASGTVGEIKRASGVEGYGNVVYINHGPNYQTRYAHLDTINPALKKGALVSADITEIGTVGDTGAEGAYHLHYEILVKAPNDVGYEKSKHAIDPLTVISLADLLGDNGSSLLPGVSSTTSTTQYYQPKVELAEKSTSIYAERIMLIKHIQNLNDTLNRGMVQAFPTIKVFITVGNEDQDYFQGSAGASIQYYEIKGVRDFHLNTNNEDNPIDTISMVVSDPNFLRTDEMASLASRGNIDYQNIGTDYELQFTNNRMKLRPGMKLHVRMGFANNPNNLNIVFNGSVIATNNIHANAVQVIAESFGKELLTDVLGTTNPQRLGGGWNSSTGTIFADLMQVPGIYHFGKSFSFMRLAFELTLGDATDPESKSLLGSGAGVFQSPFKKGTGSAVANGNYLFGFKVFSNVIQRSRIYTNIYASDVEYIDNEFNSPFKNLVINFWSVIKPTTYDFFAVKETPWDVMKQMCYRHPGTKVKPLWYQDRCTLFFGIKEQMYIAKDIDGNLMKAAANEIKEQDDVFTNPDAPGALNLYADYRINRMDLVTNFHIISSELNLISNGIKLNGDYYTKVNVGYREENSDISSIQEWETTEMALDDNLAPWEIRATELNLSGCDGRYMSFRYGTAFLIAEAEKMYGGSIFITGNPLMKSGDYAYIQDETRMLFGMIKIRECIHHYDERNGFTTEITPGQFVEHAEFVRSTFFLRLGLAARSFMEEKSPEVLGGAYGSNTLQAAINYLTIQEQWSKLSRSKGSSFSLLNRNDPGLINSTLDTITDDPLLFAGYSLVGFLTNITGYYTLKYALPKGPLFRAGGTVSNFFVNSFSGALPGVSTLGSFLGGEITTIRTKLGVIRAGSSGVFSKTGQVAWNLARSAGRTSLGIGFRVTSSVLRTRLVGFAIANPVGILLTAITVLTMSWASARIQENKYTRQPALFYPLIQHGRPYVAGMTGALRNTYWDSLQREGTITLTALKKAATIVNNKRLLSGEDAIPFAAALVNTDSNRRRVTFSTDAEGKITKNIYDNSALLSTAKQE